MDLGSEDSKTSLSEGASFYEGKELTVLQKHVSFFDRNKDGIIYPSETFAGFRAVGCNLFLSTVGTVFAHLSSSGRTRPGKGFDLRFPVVVENIKNGMHGCDTGTYDKEGRFVPSKFEEIFSKHAHKNPNSLTSDELYEMLKANRKPMDFAGVASLFEWRVTYLLGKDKNGLLQKDAVQAIFDGSLFEKLEKERAPGKHGVATE